MSTTNEELCKICQTIFAAPGLPSAAVGNLMPHHASFSELMRAVENECPLCTQILRRILKGVEYEEQSVDDAARVIESFSYRWRGGIDSTLPILKGLDAPVLEFKGNNYKSVPNAVPPRTLFFNFNPPVDAETRSSSSYAANHTASKATLNLAKEWITQCNENHDSCRSRLTYRRLPTRLVEVSNHDNAEKLDSSLVRVRESSGLPVVTPYMTLSHCWGEGSYLQLLSTNKTRLMDNFHISELPMTFQDAIHITRYMNIQYLWIDSMCIIQDSMDDWHHESTSMDSVYKLSHCTIAASSGRDSEFGCFRTRHPNAIKPIRVEMGWNLNALRKGSYDLVNRSTVYPDVEWSPLSKRGWVLQERFLSPRILHFSNPQIYFECEGGFVSETEPRRSFSLRKALTDARKCLKAVDVKDKDLKKRTVARELDTIMEAWSELLRRYSACNLSREEDRLVAFGGLAKEFQRLTGWEYIAGLWRENLEFGLLWYSLDGKQKVCPRPSIYRAPSWSWASVEKWIYPFDPKQVTLNGNVLVEILDANVTTVGLEPFGQVSDGYIKMKGEIFPAEWSRSLGKPFALMMYHLLSDNAQMSIFHPDDTFSDLSAKVWCLPIVQYTARYGTVQDIHGIVLKKLDDGRRDNTFCRIGHFTGSMTDTHRFPGEHSERFTFTII